MSVEGGDGHDSAINDDVNGRNYSNAVSMDELEGNEPLVANAVVGAVARPLTLDLQTNQGSVNMKRSVPTVYTKLPHENALTKLNLTWKKKILPKQLNLVKTSSNDQLKSHIKKQIAAAIKQEKMTWVRPKKLNRHDKILRDLNAASVSTYMHPMKNKVRAVPSEVRNVIRPKRPRSAAANRKIQSKKASKLTRPQSAAARIVRTVTSSPKIRSKNAESSSATAFVSFLRSLSRFSSSVSVNASSTRSMLLRSLSESIKRLNASVDPNPDESDATILQRLYPKTNPPKPQRRQRPKSTLLSSNEPWHFGKTSAYVSPVVLHRQEKARAELLARREEKKRKKKKHRRPDTASDPLRARDRETRERPWSSPVNRGGQSSIRSPSRFVVRLKRFSLSPDESCDMLDRISNALAPSQSANNLPFALYLDMRCNGIDQVLKVGGSRSLKAILTHPSVLGVDLRSNHSPHRPETPEVDDHDQELCSISPTRLAASSAAVHRMDLRRSTRSPPLVSLLVDPESSTEGVFHDVAPPDPSTSHLLTHEPSLAITLGQDGYYHDKRPLITYNNYPGMPSTHPRLPKFEDLISSLNLYHPPTSALGENSSEIIFGSPLNVTELRRERTESQVVAGERLKHNMVPKGDYGLIKL